MTRVSNNLMKACNSQAEALTLFNDSLEMGIVEVIAA